MAKRKVAVLISGEGTNLQALIDASQQPGFPAEIALVISNKASANGINRAKRAGIETQVIQHRDFATREDFDTALDAALKTAGVEFVCLAGFMRILTKGFVEAWRDRVINIHPSLLPSFKGINAIEQALESGVRLTGVSVHFLRPEMDSGPIIAQAAVPVLDGDDADTLAARIHAVEHRIYPAVLRWIGEGRVRVVGERVAVEGVDGDADAPLFSPAIA